MAERQSRDPADDTAGRIIDEIGERRLISGCDVSERTVRSWRSRGRFPSGRYMRICELAGRQLPWTLFTQRGRGSGQ